MSNYRKLHKELTKNSTQRMITDYVTKTTTTSIIYEAQTSSDKSDIEVPQKHCVYYQKIKAIKQCALQYILSIIILLK